MLERELKNTCPTIYRYNPDPDATVRRYLAQMIGASIYERQDGEYLKTVEVGTNRWNRLFMRFMRTKTFKKHLHIFAVRRGDFVGEYWFQYAYTFVTFSYENYTTNNIKIKSAYLSKPRGDVELNKEATSLLQDLVNAEIFSWLEKAWEYEM